MIYCIAILNDYGVVNVKKQKPEDDKEKLMITCKKHQEVG